MKAAITVTAELRPAIWSDGNGRERRVLVHTLSTNDDFSLVELEDGTCTCTFHERLRYLDSAERFGEFGWEDGR